MICVCGREQTHLLPRPNEVINPAAPPCMPGRREGREAQGNGSDGWPSSPSCPITSAYLCMYIQGNPHIPTQSWSPILSYHLCILVYLCVYWTVLSHGLGGVGGDVWCDLSCHSIHHIGRKAVVCICVLYCIHIHIDCSSHPRLVILYILLSYIILYMFVSYARKSFVCVELHHVPD